MEYLLLGIIIIVVIILIYAINQKNKPQEPPAPPKLHEQTPAEIKHEDIATMAAYIRARQEEERAAQRLKELKKAEMREKLEVFKQTKDSLKEKLKNQIDEKQWRPLDAILKSADKGGTGIYILYNETKDRYYVGQAKQIFKRVRDHFAVEDIALDFLGGDSIKVKFLTANELDSDYRLDHIEKTGIEIFNSDKNGYNKTTGNL